MLEKDKQRQRQIAKLLYESRDIEQVLQLKELLIIRLNDTKDKMVSCPLENVRVYQGEAQAYKKLIELIEKPNDFRD